MDVFKHWILTLFLSVFITACGGESSGRAPSIPTDPPSSIQEQLYSSITDVTYPIDIYLPDNYEERTGPLPVIYASDGQYSSTSYGRLIEEYGAEVVLVSVYEGPAGRRNIDYLPPGVDNYYLFLTQELIPFIEAEYDIEPSQRTLVGHSFGGAMASYVMLSEPIGAEFFKHFIISDGSFWRIPDTIYPLEAERYEASPRLAVTAIFSAATGYQGNYYWVDEFYNTMSSRNYSELKMPPILMYRGADHRDMWFDTFRDSLPILFPQRVD
ncbi:alpha/beta hydrolase [Vibrio rotiferianus]|uniref:alpha/beta hydrolase n=1 Tax=Vibrio rotiferianus TaxID=190895 RepID=UPI00406A724F